MSTASVCAFKVRDICEKRLQQLSEYSGGRGDAWGDSVNQCKRLRTLAEVAIYLRAGVGLTTVTVDEDGAAFLKAAAS